MSAFFIPSICVLLQLCQYQSHAGSPTVDKIFPSKGYVKGNIWVISHRANKMKSNMTVDELEHFAQVIRGKLVELSNEESTNAKASL